MISRCVISHVCVCTFVCVCKCVYTALNRIQSLNPYKFGTPLYHTLSPVHNIRSSERCNRKCIQNDLDVRCNVCICWNRNYFYSAYLTRVQIILYALPVATRYGQIKLCSLKRILWTHLYTTTARSSTKQARMVNRFVATLSHTREFMSLLVITVNKPILTGQSRY